MIKNFDLIYLKNTNLVRAFILLSLYFLNYYLINVKILTNTLVYHKNRFLNSNQKKIKVKEKKNKY